jgi:hypothetical protein
VSQGGAREREATEIRHAPLPLRLLSSFATTVEEITLIANPPSAAHAGNRFKGCEMRSYVDPFKGAHRRPGQD